MTDNQKKKNERDGALVKSVVSDQEAIIIESLLNSFGIPVLKKYKGTGDAMRIYMGTTNLGVDIYVPLDMREKAEEILNAESAVEVEDDTDNEAAEAKNNIKKSRVKAWLLMVIFCLGGLTVALAVLLGLFGG